MTCQIKRSRFVLFSMDESAFVDIRAFLRGDLRVSSRTVIYAHSLSASRRVVTLDDLRLLSSLSSKAWVEADNCDLDRVEKLAQQGLLVSDGTDPELTRFRRIDRQLEECRWHPYAAFYHFATRDADTGAPLSDTESLAMHAVENARDFVERYGPPPDPFYHPPDVEETIQLPLTTRSGEFARILRERRTVRAFDTSRKQSLEHLGVLIRSVYGCQGVAQLTEDVALLHKTSPSGGSLHPIEAYPLILRVETLPPGFYHYNVRDHSLGLIQRMTLDDAEGLASELGNGQTHFGQASAVVAMAARFRRNYWKYRASSRAYSVVLMDAAHLSQTFYLVAAELGLGAFYSAAIDARRPEEILGLDPREQGLIAACGCGVIRQDGTELGLDFQSFEPRASGS